MTRPDLMKDSRLHDKTKRGERSKLRDSYGVQGGWVFYFSPIAWFYSFSRAVAKERAQNRAVTKERAQKIKLSGLLEPNILSTFALKILRI